MGKRSLLWTFGAFVLIVVVAWGIGYTLSSKEIQNDKAQDEVASEGSYRGWVVDPVVAAPDFLLTDQDGRPFRFSDLEGTAVVLFFGYTTCPDVCPTTLAQFRDVKAALAHAAEHVRFVFVSVDPERDSPQQLKRYLAIFDESFIGLTGDAEVLARVWDDYGIAVERVDQPGAPGNYWVNHTSLSFIVDTDGLLRLVHPFGMPPEDMVHDLIHVVAQRT